MKDPVELELGFVDGVWNLWNHDLGLDRCDEGPGELVAWADLWGKDRNVAVRIHFVTLIGARP